MPERLVHWTREDDIAVVVIDNPPMNVLSIKVIELFDECLKEININNDCRAMIHSIAWKICLFPRWQRLMVMRWGAAWNLPLPATSE